MRVPPRYRLLRVLGQGAQGAVCLVEDTFEPGRPIALKVLSGQDEVLADALTLEFEVLAGLCHPRLARVFDFGRLLPGEPGGPATFLTREYLEGETLDRAAEGGGLEEVVRLGVELCRALTPLHRAGLVHGDLKPANAIVDDHGSVRLIDFGVVRQEGEKAKWVTGTLPYMAPEVISGRPADARSDLYAFGVVLFELLTGRVPFDGPMKKVLGAHIAEDVPSLEPGRTRFEGAPEGAYDRIVTVARRLLEKDPANRFPGARELEAALEGALPAGAPPRDDELLGLSPPRVGASGAFEALEDAMDRRLRRRDPFAPRIALLRGGPGAGKSTLLRELRWRAQLRGHHVVETTCAASPTPHGPLPDLLRRLGLLAGPVGQLGGVLSVSLAQQATFAAIAVARRRPLLIVVEDLHHAGPDVAGALRYVAHSAPQGDPLLIVASALDDGATEIERALGEHHRVDLHPLCLADVTELTRTMVGRLDEDLASSVLEWTGGNPLFCVETLRSIAGAGGDVGSRLASLAVPRRLETFWSHRVEAASERSRQVLAASVVVGRPVDAGVLAVVAGLDEAAVAEAADSLTRQGLLAREPSGALCVSHVGLGPAARRALSPQDLAAMHERAARLLEGRQSRRAERAHHLLRAGLSARKEAETLAVAVARELLDAGSSREAARLLEPAMAEWQGPGIEAASLLLAEALHGAGEYIGAEVLLEALLGKLDGAERATTGALLGRVRSARGDFDGAKEAWSEAIGALRDGGARARVGRDLGRMLLKRGDQPGAEIATEGALREEGVDDPLRADLLCTMGLLRDYGGDPEEALRSYEEALSIAERAGARREQSSALTHIAITHQRHGRYELAWQRYDQSLSIARHLGDLGSMALLHGNMGGLAHSMGQPVRALEQYLSALRLARTVGRRGTAVSAGANLGLLHLTLGEHERARHELEESLAGAEELGMPQVAAQTTGHLGELASLEGRLDDAAEALRRATDRYEALGHGTESVEVGLELASVLVERGSDGDLGEARRLARRADDVVGGGGFPRLAVLASLVRGRLAAAIEEDAAALDLFEQARSGALAEGTRELAWQADAAAAGVHLRMGEDSAARACLLRAAGVLEHLAEELPNELRKSYWQDRRRGAVRSLLAALGAAPAG